MPDANNMVDIILFPIEEPDLLNSDSLKDKIWGDMRELPDSVWCIVITTKELLHYYGKSHTLDELSKTIDRKCINCNEVLPDRAMVYRQQSLKRE